MSFPKRSAAVIAALFLFAVCVQAQTFTFFASGPNENPPNASPGTGFGTVTLSLATHVLMVNMSFTGLTGTTTAAHIHDPVLVPGGTAGVATQTPSFVGFPLGVTSGTFMTTLDMSLASTWNPAYITANGGTPAGAAACEAATGVDATEGATDGAFGGAAAAQAVVDETRSRMARRDRRFMPLFNAALE